MYHQSNGLSAVQNAWVDAHFHARWFYFNKNVSRCALEVPCEDCGSGVGKKCQTTKGNDRSSHKGRFLVGKKRYVEKAMAHETAVREEQQRMREDMPPTLSQQILDGMERIEKLLQDLKKVGLYFGAKNRDQVPSLSEVIAAKGKSGPHSLAENGDQPSIEQLLAWEQEGGCEALDGCWVEPDGTCPHGQPSWLRHLGMI